MVSTHLKNISQIASFPQVGVKIKNVVNHNLAFYYSQKFPTEVQLWGPCLLSGESSVHLQNAFFLVLFKLLPVEPLLQRCHPESSKNNFGLTAVRSNLSDMTHQNTGRVNQIPKHISPAIIPSSFPPACSGLQRRACTCPLSNLVSPASLAPGTPSMYGLCRV